MCIRDRILGNGNNLVREYLDQSFKPSLVNSFIIEPGHHYEWAWLLNWSDKIHQRKKYGTLTKTLFDTGWRLGWDFNNGGVSMRWIAQTTKSLFQLKDFGRYSN